MAHKLTELQALGAALGFELVDELPEMRKRLESLPGAVPGALDLSALLPLLQGLMEAAGADRSTTSGWHLSGVVDGVRVNVRPVSSTSSQGGRYETRVEALFDPPLTLGLRITYEPFVSRFVERITGRHDLQAGNEELDEIIHLQAEDADGARAILADPAIQRVLLDAYGTSPFPEVDDGRARVRFYGFETDLQTLRRAMATLASIVRALGGARA